ncbi:MAG: hypothetical protein EOP07_04230 [Proteobacteria bacterium]|nr:MAG: hypothetical protein EOP07_04230 [Pseudomonadota bacterium]
MKKYISAALLSFTFAAMPLIADVSPSINIPTGGGAVQATPPDNGPIKAVPKAERQAAKANKRANMETCKADLSAGTNGAKSTVASNLCTDQGLPRRGNTVPAQDANIPVNPNVEVNSIGGR